MEEYLPICSQYNTTTICELMIVGDRDGDRLSNECFPPRDTFASVCVSQMNDYKLERALEFLNYGIDKYIYVCSTKGKRP